MTPQLHNDHTTNSEIKPQPETPSWGWDESEDGEQKKIHHLLGTGPIEKLPDSDHLPEVLREFRYFKRNIIIGCWNFGPILDAIKGSERFAVVTGLRQHATMHLGTKCVIDQLGFYQKEFEADVFVAFSDVESWLLPANGQVSIRTSIEHALSNYMVDILALGLKPKNKKSILRVHSEWARREILSMATALIHYVPNDYIAKQISLDEQISLAQLFFPLVVAADILHVQLEKYGGSRPILVPVGYDQHHFMMDAWRIMKAYIEDVHADFSLPSFTFHGMLMDSDKRPMSRFVENGIKHASHAIFLSDDLEVIISKINDSDTGVQADGSRKPQNCPVHELLRFHESEENIVLDIQRACIGETHTCEECKVKVSNRITQIMSKYKVKRKETEDDKEYIKFILDQDIFRGTESIVNITESSKKGE
ncbi:tryptophanyl-tRNA synthetase [Anaerolineae bacterium]|nr:tryptophanyl-tRNA synthetase [Anaerolineae bacterium]